MVSAVDQYAQDYKRATDHLKAFKSNVQECSEALKKGQSTAKVILKHLQSASLCSNSLTD